MNDRKNNEINISNENDSSNNFEFNAVLATENIDTDGNVKFETDTNSNEKRIFTKENFGLFGKPEIKKLKKEDNDNFLQDNSCYDFEKPDFDKILEEQKENENKIEDLIEKYDSGKLILFFLKLFLIFL